MNLTNSFQISIYSLTALSGLMLAYGEESLLPSGLTPFFCVIALFFNERRRLVRLNFWWSNGLGLAAMGMTLFEFFGDRADARLLSGAHFLVYLTWVVLFLEKHAQQYWWLFALGLLQVAVGTVMTLSGWYGLLMLSYLLLALWTMAVFHLYQGSLEFVSSAHSRQGAALNGPMEHPAARRLLDVETTVENAVQQDIPDCWITSRFVFGVTGISVTGLILGMAMFLLVPRVWLGKGNIFASQVQAMSRPTTGVSNEVRLGHLGRILESANQVLEVRLYDNDTDKRVSLEEFVARQGLNEPLFRGNVFDSYANGRWSSSNNLSGYGSLKSGRSPWATDPGMIRQEYVLYPQGANVLFALRPISYGNLRPNGRIDVSPNTHVLFPRTELPERVEYRILSRPYTPNAADQISIGRNSLSQPFRDQRSLADSLHMYLDFPADRLVALQKLAAAWTAPNKLIGNESMSEERRRATSIESVLRDSGQFTYSLNMQIQDPERDPVEDFLFNRKSGHCEYFASALALMLRAVGVPSRLVTGFKGADPVNGGEYYEVQQRQAHAWVEAFVDGAWIVLDATPAARDESVRNFGTNAEFWKTATDSLSALWSTYVISMSPNRQKETLYDPFAGGISFFRELFDSAVATAEWVKGQFTSPDQILTGTGSSLLSAMIVGLVLAVALARRAWHWYARKKRAPYGNSFFSRWFGWLTRRWRTVPASRMIVEFYEKFLRLVGARGMTRQDQQTQREFAQDVELTLGESLRAAGLTTLPHDVTDLYYRVRFGGIDLPDSEIVELNQRMHRFADLLRSPNGHHRKGERGNR
jgi:protein-glutamine gamma-glutamyltransferase